MREVKLGTNRIYLYDSIHDLPEERHHEFTKYALLDIGVGCDMTSVAAHHQRLDTFLVHGKTDEAIAERKNLHLNYFYAIEKINFKSLCFGVLVHRVNNDYKFDFTLDGLQSTVKELSRLGLKHTQVSDIVEEVKKKLKQNFGLLSLNDM